MKILYIAHRIPYPPNKGDKIRSFNVVRYLSLRHEVDLICLADNPDDIRYAKDLEKFCNRVFVLPFDTRLAKIKGLISLATGKSISAGYFYHKPIRKTFDQWVSDTDYDAVICFSSPMAEYVFRSETSNSPKKPTLIMDFCDADSDKWRQYSRQSRFPFDLIYLMEYKRLLEYEKKINKAFDLSILISIREAELFRHLYPKASKLAVIPNGVDSEYFSPASTSEASGDILMFAGAMDYHANADGVGWFCESMFPAIRATYPDARFHIVGSNPGPKVTELGKQDGVVVTGFVDDVRPYYHAAKVCVIPLRLARGVQNKVLEAMSMGKAIVATSAAVRGISPIPGDCLMIADTPREFSAKVSKLLDDDKLRGTLGTNAREFVRRCFDWQTIMRKFEELCRISA